MHLIRLATLKARFWPVTSYIVVLVLLASGCHATKSPVCGARAVGHGVMFAGPSQPANSRVNVVRAVDLHVPNTFALSDTFELLPSGPLANPITVTVPINTTVSSDQAVVVATAETPQGPWDFLAGSIGRDRRSVSFTTSHFSLFGIRGVDVRAQFEAFRKDFLDPLSGSFLAEAQKPRCASEREARGDGYSITSTPSSTLYWCFGMSGDNRILRVVNNRRYPLEVTHPGLPMIAGGDIHLDLRQLSRSISGNMSIIGPREAATFRVSLAPDTRSIVSTQFDGFGQSLYALQVGVQALVNILTRFGQGSKLKSAQITSDLLQANSCTEALRRGPAAVLGGCFNPHELWRALGVKALLVMALMVFGPMFEFFHSEFNFLGDQFNHRDRYQVTISRARRSSPTPNNGSQTSSGSSSPGGTGSSAGGGGNPVPPPSSPSGSPAVALARGPAAPAGYRYAITLRNFPANSNMTVTCHDSVDPGGFYTFALHTDGNGSAFTQSYCYSGDGPDHWARANGIESNHVIW